MQIEWLKVKWNGTRIFSKVKSVRLFIRNYMARTSGSSLRKIFVHNFKMQIHWLKVRYIDRLGVPKLPSIKLPTFKLPKFINEWFDLTTSWWSASNLRNKKKSNLLSKSLSFGVNKIAQR